MRVAIDIGPLKSGHRERGIGSYTKNLVNSLENNKSGINVVTFENGHVPAGVDLVHYPYFDLFFHTLPLQSRIKRVVTVHDVIPLVFPEHFPAGIKGSINLFLQKRALGVCQAVICDSEASKNDIIKKLSYPTQKIFSVYLAAAQSFSLIKDKKKLATTTKKYNLPKNFVLYVGDVNWNKNLLNLIEGVKISDMSLVMVGKAIMNSNLAQVREINRKIENLKIKNKVIKIGFIEENDLVAIYNLADLTLLPSYYEGFGLPLLESMACGTPVVCSNVASLAEIGSKYALYCDPSNPDDIAQKIKDVLLTKKERISQNLVNHASKFTWGNVAQETINVYKYALENP